MTGHPILQPQPIRCNVCDKVLTNRDPVVFNSNNGQPTAHETCVKCPNCQSTFTIWRGVDIPAGRHSAELRCLSCLHGWTGHNVIAVPDSTPAEGE